MNARSDKTIRILIVDDHALVREGLRMLLDSQPGMVVVSDTGTGGEAVELAAREAPNIILLDLDLAGESGISFLRDLLNAGGGARIIVLTGVRNPELHRRAIGLGAMGLVLKDQVTNTLVKAIEKVNAGEVWLDRTTTARVLTEMSREQAGSMSDQETAKIASLTDREREIIKLICSGLRNRQIADQLFISEATVRNHLTSILSKLELSDRFDLAIYSFRHGLAKPPV